MFITWLIARGSYEQAKINLDVEAPSPEPRWRSIYAAGVVFGASAAVLLLRELCACSPAGRSEADLVMVKESEEAAELEALQAELKRADPGARTGRGPAHDRRRLPRRAARAMALGSRSRSR